MKIKGIALLFVSMVFISLTACGDKKVKSPIDYPNSKWTCDIANITFSVSSDCEITDATMIDKREKTAKLIL